MASIVLSTIQFPLELVQLIVDHLWRNRKALRTFCLVSKAWRDAAIRHLFDKVFLDEDNDYMRWSALMRSSPEIATRCVRKVKVWSSIQSYAVAILVPMPRATGLEWCPSDTSNKVTPAISDFLSLLPSLNKLQMVDSFDNVQEFEKFLSMCPNLRRLHIDVSSIVELGPPATSSDASHLSPPVCNLGELEELRIEVRPSSSLHDWVVDQLLQHTCPAALRSLVVGLDAFSLGALARIIDMFAHSLQSLSVSPGFDADLWDAMPHLSCPLLCLEIITFGLIQLRDNWQPLSTLDWVYRFIEGPEHLDKVMLDSADSPFHWKKFVSEFLPSKFPNFRTLGFRLLMEKKFRKETQIELEAAVKRALPNLKQEVTFHWKDLNTGMDHSDSGEEEEGDEENETDEEDEQDNGLSDDEAFHGWMQLETSL